MVLYEMLTGRRLYSGETAPETLALVLTKEPDFGAQPRQWSPGLLPTRGPANRYFDLHPDGQRMAVLKAAEQPAEEKRDRVVLIQNFFEELRRAAPAKR